MDVWIFNHYALPPTEAGGTRHFDLALRLTQMGHQVSIIASSFHHTNQHEMRQYNGAPVLIEDIQGVRFCWIKTTPYTVNNWRRFKNMYDYYRVAKSIFKHLPDKPDVCIGSIVHPLAPLAAIAVAKHYMVPFVYEIRDLWPQTFMDMGVWKPSHPAVPVFKWMEAKAVKNARLVINLSPLTDGYLAKHYGAVNSIYLPNGVDVEKMEQRRNLPEPTGNATLQKLSQLKESGKQIVMFTGSVVQSNNLRVVLDVAKQLKNTAIAMVVVGTGDMRPVLEAEARGAGLENLYFMDPVPKTMVPHLLKKADIMLLIQGMVLWGSMNKLFDYLSSGNPVISVTEAVHNDPVALYNAGIAVPERSAASIAGAIKTAIKLTATERADMAARALDYVQKNHDIKLLAAQLETALQQLVDSRS